MQKVIKSVFLSIIFLNATLIPSKAMSAESQHVDTSTYNIVAKNKDLFYIRVSPLDVNQFQICRFRQLDLNCIDFFHWSDFSKILKASDSYYIFANDFHPETVFLLGVDGSNPCQEQASPCVEVNINNFIYNLEELFKLNAQKEELAYQLKTKDYTFIYKGYTFIHKDGGFIFDIIVFSSLIFTIFLATGVPLITASLLFFVSFFIGQFIMGFYYGKEEKTKDQEELKRLNEAIDSHLRDIFSEFNFDFSDSNFIKKQL